MKRIIPLLLVLSLLLCACGKKNAEVTTEPTNTSAATTESTTVPTTIPETSEETTVPTFPPLELGNRNPLNGEPLDAPWTGRAIAVVINNHEEAMPQRGITQADVLYEIETEGGITRRLGLFTDPSAVDVIGPIRSARTFFVNLVSAYDIPLTSCGGSHYAMANQYNYSEETVAWDHIDEMFNGGYFFRDSDRYKNQGYAWEHTLFITGENLTEVSETLGYNRINEEGTDYGLRFADERPWEGDSAQEVIIRFNGFKETTATYRPEENGYAIAQYGEIGVDENNQKELVSRNVMVLFADQQKKNISSFYTLIGSGEGYLASGGEYIPIQWHRESVNHPFTYTMADGAPLALTAGNTYIAIISLQSNVEFA